MGQTSKDKTIVRQRFPSLMKTCLSETQLRTVEKTIVRHHPHLVKFRGQTVQNVLKMLIVELKKENNESQSKDGDRLAINTRALRPWVCSPSSTRFSFFNFFEKMNKKMFSTRYFLQKQEKSRGKNIFLKK